MRPLARVVAAEHRLLIEAVERYDAETATALIDQRDAGKKLMLITNSDWAYTRDVMAWAFDHVLPERPE